ncbi:ArsR/SmtB family transcription factor [Domibacillus iocasae]|uniref:Transcriptional regulator n=1 Tax=Domibacillus iocasae TaxID=1714016 RepID=A0A1E7DSJ9_9BACI|nr:transcriptional regulator [Domibacillus iocasae]
MDITTLSALAEPNRFKMVELLKGGPLTVGEIADWLAIRQPQASKHLRVLSEAGIVEVEVNANRRIYRLKSQPFESLDAWLDSYRHLWEERFNRLDAYLEEIKAEVSNKKDV